MTAAAGWREVTIEPGSLRPPAPPDRTSSKIDRGTIVVVAGGVGCPGAALLSATAALRAGAGRVQIVTHASHATQIGIAVPESMVFGCESRRDRWFVSDPARDALHDADVVLVGPGLTAEGPDLAATVLDIAGEQAVVVLDAAALCDVDTDSIRPRCVLLPNDTEVGMIGGGGAPDIASPRLVPSAAIDVACATGATVAVRGSVTAVADPSLRLVYVLDDPCPGLAVAGSGDVLAGTVSACCARSDDQGEQAAATAWAVAAHHEAGRMLAERVGPTGFLAGEIAGAIPAAIRCLTAQAGTSS
jgi:hydroxyethylthiazole kinase-like uncharacterized protein yjeF